MKFMGILIIMSLVVAVSLQRCELTTPCKSCVAAACFFLKWENGTGCFVNETSVEGGLENIVGPGGMNMCELVSPESNDDETSSSVTFIVVIIVIIILIVGFGGGGISFAVYRRRQQARTAPAPTTIAPFAGDLNMAEANDHDHDDHNEEPEADQMQPALPEVVADGPVDPFGVDLFQDIPLDSDDNEAEASCNNGPLDEDENEEETEEFHDAVLAPGIIAIPPQPSIFLPRLTLDEIREATGPRRSHRRRKSPSRYGYE